MKAVTKILTGAAGVVALVGMAAPAAAQYPGYYPGYGQGYNQGTNVVGQVLNSILNPYGQQQYGGMNTQAAVSQCTAAVQARLSRSGYGNNGYGGYNPYGGYNAYGGYANAQSSARVLGITRVEPRSNTTMRVRGFASSGMRAGYQGGYGGYQSGYGGYQGGYGGYQGGYGGYQGGYGGYNTAQSADLSFKCDVDYRGYVRDIDISRRY